MMKITIINIQSYIQIILAVSGIYWTMDVSKAITEKDGLKVGINEMSSLRNFKMFFRFCLLRLLYILLLRSIL